MAAATQFKIEAIVKGTENVEGLKNAVKRLQGSVPAAASDLNKLREVTANLGKATDLTENALRAQIAVMRDLRGNVQFLGKEYKDLTLQIQRAERQLAKGEGGGPGGGRLQRFGQTAGAVAASSVFGGPEGLVGAGIGAFFGPGGALAGGAIGAQVGQIRQQLGGTATLAADLEKQRTALRLVLKDTAEYNAALSFLAKTSKDYAIPQDQLIKGFTQLAASVVGAGGNIKDTKTAFEGITAGIRGTGRSLQDLDSALVATSQVFSKGKVTAEELRGQIGERLPGAFTLFAQSIGKTPQELDKALERGEVSLQDFLKFSKTLFGEYGENAKIIANSPAAAGDRLQTSLKNLSESVGKLLLPIGAAFQTTFANIATYIDGAAKRLADFLGLNKSNAQKIGELNNLIITQQRAIQREREKVSQGVSSKEEAAFNIKEFESRIAKLQAEANVLKAFDKASANQQKDRAGLSGTTPGPSQSELDKAERERERKQREALQRQTEMNRLLQEQVKLNYEAGAVGAGDLARLDAEQELLKQLVRLRIEEAGLTSKSEDIRRQKIVNITKEFEVEKSRIAEERKEVLADIAAIGKEAEVLVSAFDQKSIKTESPLQKELQAIDNLILDAIKNADTLLVKLTGKGGTDPATAVARARLGNFKADLEAKTPRERLSLASSNLVKSDADSLREQITELSRFGVQLSTLDQLKQKFLGDWEKLDPILKGQLETLAATVDKLTQVGQIVDGIANSIGTGLTSAFGLLIDGTDNWGRSLRNIAATVLKDIANELLRILVIEQLISAVRGVLKGVLPSVTPSANGNVFAQNGIQPFATGGIVDKPTFFKFANGGAMSTGVMGEAGPEAIIPLRRGRDGKLGVAGGGSTNVTVNVDAKGTSVQGNAGQGEALARAVAQAVQAELIRQKRPGGLIPA
jgi:tape measure domain-containing protein